MLKWFFELQYESMCLAVLAGISYTHIFKVRRLEF
jgi:hypothetical protein